MSCGHRRTAVTPCLRTSERQGIRPLKSQPLLGFDIGGTKSAVVLGTQSGEIVDRQQIATGEPEPTMSELISAAKRMTHGIELAACGMSVGSPLSRERGLVQSPANLPHWVDVPVRDMVQRAFPRVPFNLENDADAAALAEWRWGLDRKLDHVVYLTCGTGQGAGLILGGRLHRGASNLAGEIGHVRLLQLGPVGCRKAGSVEGLTSGRALGELAKLRLGEPHFVSSLERIQPQELTGRHVVEAAQAGDQLATWVVIELAKYLGQTCAILIDVLNPQRISLGSLALRLKNVFQFVDLVRAAAQEEAMEGAFESCTIDVAALGDKVQDLAALAAAAEALPR